MDLLRIIFSPGRVLMVVDMKWVIVKPKSGRRSSEILITLVVISESNYRVKDFILVSLLIYE